MTWQQQLLLQWPNAVVSIVSVLVGAAIAWASTQWAIGKQSRLDDERRRREQAEADARDIKRLRIYLDRLTNELQRNQRTLNVLANALDDLRDLERANTTMRKLTESLATVVYGEFVVTGLDLKLSPDVSQALFDIRQKVADFRAWGSQVSAEVDVHTLRGDTDSAKKRLEQVGLNSRILGEAVTFAIKGIGEGASGLKG